MKYLGIVLDSRWRFEAHFQQLAPKVQRCASSLATLLPNLGGAGPRCRTLYMNVVRSMMLYGAPIWHASWTPVGAAILRKLHRTMALRSIRGYRTVSYTAACLLAGTAPWELVAQSYAQLFSWRTRKIARGETVAPRELARKRSLLYAAVLKSWEEQLALPNAGIRTVEAVRPIFWDWLNRKHGSLTFRLVQVLTGHGCFGEYLYNIARREPTPRCHHCRSEVDTAQHTLQECPAWAAQRRELVSTLGDDLSLPTVVRLMVGETSLWDATVVFCEVVLSQKEDAEREREKSAEAPVVRRRRTGRGRRRGGGQTQLGPPP